MQFLHPKTGTNFQGDRIVDKDKQMLSYSIHNFDVSHHPYFKQSENAYKKAGIVVKRVKSNADVKVFLTSFQDMKKMYPSVAKAGLSVMDRLTQEIHLLQSNWDSIPTHLGSEFKNLDDYRVALISHELSHALGHDHVKCACTGCDMDVRQQPSRSLGGCKPTTDVVLHPHAKHSSVNL